MADTIVESLYGVLGFKFEGARDAKAFNDAINNAERKLRRLVSESSRARDELSKLGPAFDHVSKSAARVATVVTAAAGALGYGFVKEAVDLQDSMADVNKVMDLTTEQQERYRRSLRQMSTEIPIVASGLANITASAAQAGIPEENILSFTEFSAKAATAFDITAAAAGDAFVIFRNVLKLNQEGLEDFGNTINHISNNSAANAEKIVDFSRRAAGAAQALGLSAPELAGFGSALIGAGVQSETAARAVASLARRTASDIPKVVSAFQDLNIDQDEFLRRLADGDGQAALTELFDTLSNIDKYSQTEIINNLFGGEFSKDFIKLVQNTDLLAKGFSLATDEAARYNSVQKEFENRIKTASAQATLLKNVIFDLADAPTANLLKWFTSVATSARALLSEFSALNDTTEVLMTLFEKLGLDEFQAFALASAFEDAGEAIMSVVDLISSALGMLKDGVDAVFGEGTFDTAVIYAFIAALTVLATGGIITTAIGVLGGLASAVGALLSPFGLLVSAVGLATPKVTLLSGALKALLPLIGTVLTNPLGLAKAGLIGLSKAAIAATLGIAQIGFKVKALPASIASFVKTSVNNIKSLGASIANLLTKLPSFADITKSSTAFIKSVGSGTKTVLSFIKAFPGLNIVIGVVSGTISALIELLSGGSIGDAAKAFIGGFWDAIVGFPLMLADWAAEIVKFLTFDFIDLTGVTSALRDAFKFDNIVAVLADFGSGIGAWIFETKETLVDGFGAALDWISDKFSAVIDKITSPVKAVMEWWEDDEPKPAVVDRVAKKVEPRKPAEPRPTAAETYASVSDEKVKDAIKLSLKRAADMGSEIARLELDTINKIDAGDIVVSAPKVTEKIIERESTIVKEPVSPPPVTVQPAPVNVNAPAVSVWQPVVTIPQDGGESLQGTIKAQVDRIVTAIKETFTKGQEATLTPPIVPVVAASPVTVALEAVAGNVATQDSGGACVPLCDGGLTETLAKLGEFANMSETTLAAAPMQFDRTVSNTSNNINAPTTAHVVINQTFTGNVDPQTVERATRTGLRGLDTSRQGNFTAGLPSVAYGE